MFKLYLNGNHMCADDPNGCDLLMVNAPAAPNGTLAVGRTWNSTTSGVPASGQQFYGLVDDVAVYDEALTAAKINAYASMWHVLDGSEPSLHAGYKFEASAPQGPLSRPVTWTGGAYCSPFVGGSCCANPNQSQIDAGKLPVAQGKYAMPLPFAPGEEWKVGQGYAATASHYGVSAFSLDMSRVNGSTVGADVYLPLGGTVKTAVDSWVDNGPGSCPKGGSISNCNHLEIEVEPGFVLSFRHLKQGSISAAPATTCRPAPRSPRLATTSTARTCTSGSPTPTRARG